MKYVALAATFFMATTATNIAVAAEISSVQCNYCSAQQLETAAIGQGTGPNKYVHDFGTGAIYKYRVIWEHEPGVNYYWALEENVEQGYLDTFANMKTFYDATSGTMNGSFIFDASSSVPAGFPGSAYDIVDNGPARTILVDYLSNVWNWPLSTIGDYFSQMILSSSWSIVTQTPAFVIIDARFPDGSRAYFKYEWPHDVLTYVEGTAIDSMGNVIPENLAAVAGGGTRNYNFSDLTNDRQRMLDRLAQFGIYITTSHGPIMACSESAAGVHCEFIR